MACVQFIGVCEVLGALGRILPLALKIRPELTTLATLGPVAITVGAMLSTLATGVVSLALMPFVLGVLCTGVADSRRRFLDAPHRRSLLAWPGSGSQDIQPVGCCAC